MKKLYWLAALTVCIIVLAWFVYQSPRKSDLDVFYQQAAKDIQAEINQINADF
jgi:hypothetical protein